MNNWLFLCILIVVGFVLWFIKGCLIFFVLGLILKILFLNIFNKKSCFCWLKFNFFSCNFFLEILSYGLVVIVCNLFLDIIGIVLLDFLL